MLRLCVTILATLALTANAQWEGLKAWPTDTNRMADENGGFEVRCKLNGTNPIVKDPAEKTAKSESEESAGPKVVVNEWTKEIKWFGPNDLELDAEYVSFLPDSDQSVLKIPENAAYGSYSCKYKTEFSAEFNLAPFFRLNHLETSTNVVAGDDLLIHCKVKDSNTEDNPGQKGLIFTWSRKPEGSDPDKVEGEPAVSDGDGLEPHIKQIRTNEETKHESFLKIEDANYKDRAYYECRVTNEGGQEATIRTLVRVKDKYAALYPFIGIVAEVVVLVLVIFICERRKTNNDDVDDDEDDSNGAVGGGARNNSNVRQRRT